MSKVSSEELNQSAMQIIMLAGDCRNLLTEAVKSSMEDAPREGVDKKLNQAKEKIVEAHRIQTRMIQYTIEDEELQTTLLFSHAQDTLMTIYSELNMTGYIIDMYRKLSDKINQ
ncbi:PTS lactose/cellobiose transporter subunit IIA [Anaerocolumna xylanovorans]|uniref:PTS system, cellobiose-specific IIA component n=1 Tax=Anaerocolumna xylanovorans DSM 12503 TaxID=1121345 RepID=A0A1M7YBQ2_9FIRM|nr:PTS lactose/cellobiose transporter subunit IIA [Anaerocolumna xylanovorans]SHO50006.1 PTS system, cellobiose-specific IIA component [Anaerocolumna xylanovorans DSM 12503]